MVPRVMHVAGGEKKEGEGFASCEAAAWILGGRCSPKWQEKIQKIHVAAIRFASFQPLPYRFQTAGLTRRPNLSLFSTCGLILIWTPINQTKAFFFSLFPLPFVPFPGISGLILPINTCCIRIILSFFKNFFLLQKEPPPPPAPPTPDEHWLMTLHAPATKHDLTS